MAQAVTCMQWVPVGAARQTPISSEDRDNIRPQILPFAEEEETPFEQGSKAEHKLYDTESEDSEEGDMEMQKGDHVLLATRAKDAEYMAMVYAFNVYSGNLYPRWSIDLSYFPLAMSWCSICGGNETGKSFAAIAGQAKYIEVFNMDVSDEYRPEMILGGHEKLNDNLGYNDDEEDLSPLRVGSHNAEVTALDWNRFADNVLVSGSADATIKLWDLNTSQHVYTRQMKGEITSLKWCPYEAEKTSLLSSSKLLLSIHQLNQESYQKWIVAPQGERHGRIEDAVWDPVNPHVIYTAESKGYIKAFDRRNTEKAMWTIDAHQKGCNTLAVSNHLPGVLVSGGMDKNVKFWDVRTGQPKSLNAADDREWKRLSPGRVLSLAIHPNCGSLLAVGGDKEDGAPRIVHDLEDTFADRGFTVERPKWGAPPPEVLRAMEQEEEEAAEHGLDEEQDDAEWGEIEGVEGEDEDEDDEDA